MRAVVQRVSHAKISVEGAIIASIERGLLIYLGIGEADSMVDIEYMVDKILHLRIFPDDQAKMNLSIEDIQGEICVVSQFTLYGDARRGRRPSYDKAANPESAKRLYENLCIELQNKGAKVSKGMFQAHMAISYTNDGPVTILLDSEKLF